MKVRCGFFLSGNEPGTTTTEYGGIFPYVIISPVFLSTIFVD